MLSLILLVLLTIILSPVILVIGIGVAVITTIAVVICKISDTVLDIKVNKED